MATLVADFVDHVSPGLKRMGKNFTPVIKQARNLREEVNKIGSKGLKKLSFSPMQMSLNLLTTGFRELFTLASRGAIALAADFILVNKQLEDLRIMMNTAAGSVEAGGVAMEKLITLSTQAPFSIDSLADSYVKLKTAGLDPLGGQLQILADSVAAFGGSSEQLKLVSIAIQQMAGKGVISMEELRRQFAEQVPSAMVVMADELDMTILEMVTKIEKGALAAGPGLEALFGGLAKRHGGAAERRMNSFTGAITLLRTQWMMLLRDVGKGQGAFKSITKVLKSTAEAINAFRSSDKGKNIIDDLSESISVFMNTLTANPEVIEEFIVTVIDAFKTVFTTFTDYGGLIISMIGITIRVFSALAATLKGVAAVSLLSASALFKIAQASLAIVDPFKLFTKSLREYYSEASSFAFTASMDLGVSAGKDLDRALGGVSAIGKLKTAFADVKQAGKNLFKGPTDSAASLNTEIDLFALRVEAGTLENMLGNIEKTRQAIAATITEARDKFKTFLADMKQEFANLDNEDWSLEVSFMDDKQANEERLKKAKEYEALAESAAAKGAAGAKEQLEYLYLARDVYKSMSTSAEKTSLDEVKAAENKFKAIKKESETGFLVIGRTAEEYDRANAEALRKWADRTNKYNRAYKEWQSLKKEYESGDTSSKEATAEQRKLELLKKNTAEIKAARIAQKDSFEKTMQDLDDLDQRLKESQGKIEAALKDGVEYSWRFHWEIGQHVDTLNSKYIDMIDNLNLVLQKQNQISGGSSSTATEGKARGGLVKAGSQYIVGELGPELFVPKVDGNIIPNNKMTSDSIDINLSVGSAPPIAVTGSKLDVFKFKRDYEKQMRLATNGNA